jgi:hypothetical protein
MTTYIIIALGAFFFILFLIFIRLHNPTSGLIGDEKIREYTMLEIQVSKNEDTAKEVAISALAAEGMFASLHGLLREDSNSQEHFSFEIASSEDGVRFYAAVPDHLLKFIEGQIYAQYPAAQIKVVEDYVHPPEDDQLHYEFATIQLEKPYFIPLKSFRDFEADPLASLTSALASAAGTGKVWLQLVIRPLPDVWQQEGYSYVDAIRAGDSANSRGSILGGIGGIIADEFVNIAKDLVIGAFAYRARVEGDGGGYAASSSVSLSPTQVMELTAIENKLSRMGFQVVFRVMSAASDANTVTRNMRDVLAAIKQFSSSTLNSFISSMEGSRKNAFNNYQSRALESEKAMTLNTEELATIFHLPTSKIATPNISWVYSRKSEPPPELPVKDCTYIGNTVYRNRRIDFGIANNDDRLRHMYVIGKSGTGKTTLFENMIVQDIFRGAGLCVLDPHGDMIDHILDRIPDDRVEDVVYINPSDSTRPIGLNLLEMADQDQKNLMADGLVSAIKQHFDYSWGPRLEYLLNYAILTLLEVPGTSMLGITRLLEDQNYQNFILHQIKDPMVMKFWEKEYKDMKGNQRLVTEAVAPIQNKVNRFLASTTIRNILGQRNSTIDMWDIMNSGKILLMNLSKGKIGSENANLLGALLVSRLQFFALQRAHIPPAERRPFYLYVDEFQNFATGSFEEILSESRKYKLGLYLTHQFTAQLPETLLKAVLGNIGTFATFALSAGDANLMAHEFSPYFTADDIISLDKFHIYIKLMMNGMTSVPFSAEIHRPWEEGYAYPPTGNRERAIELSSQKYGVDRDYVEDKINKWVDYKFDKGAAIAREHRNKTKAESTN